jgi:hypothetical protein
LELPDRAELEVISVHLKLRIANHNNTLLHPDFAWPATSSLQETMATTYHRYPEGQ